MASADFAQVDEGWCLRHRRIVLEEIEVQRSTVRVLQLQQHTVGPSATTTHSWFFSYNNTQLVLQLQQHTVGPSATTTHSWSFSYNNTQLVLQLQQHTVGPSATTTHSWSFSYNNTQLVLAIYEVTRIISPLAEHNF